MRKLFWLLLIVGLIGSFMTNPNEKDFKEFIIDKYVQEMKGNNPNIAIITEILAKPAALLTTLSLKTEDYKLCSTYTITNINGKQEQYIGIFKQFIKLK
jgi:predicted nucleotidyltransferase